jgi:hypothetical protein
MDDDTGPTPRPERLNAALRRVVLLKETGPKSAAWHRARVQTIWRLHRLLDAARAEEPAQADAPPPASPGP